MDDKPHIELVGNNDMRLWGLTAAERARRIARVQDLPVGDPRDGPALLVNLAFVFDPAWLKYFAARPGTALTLAGKVAIAHCRTPAECREVAAAIESGHVLPPDISLAVVAHEEAAESVNDELRKREQPFLLPLTQENVRAAERASYFGAYKGVTDVLTKYLWPEWALVLTRVAARTGVSPNMVTTVAALLCAAATVFFWYGWYWTGMAVGLGFMVLDTVDGKLARCTITSSWWGNIFDHGIDLIHPPFWWYAWCVGLAAYGRPLDPGDFQLIMIVILGGYVAQRLIEGAFIALFGMHIHVWRKLDSDFRLITARRNPNMVILFVSMVVARPDLGIAAVAWWTLISLAIHLLRLFQAMLVKASGGEVRSWLS